MQFKIITTDNGKHSDMKMAVTCAQDLVEDSAKLSGQDAIEMRKLENQIVDILEPHFRGLADREMAGIAGKGHEWLAEPLHAHPDTVQAMKAAVLAAYEASPFGAKMDKAMVAANVHEVVSKFIRDGQNMHRDWFAGAGMVGHHTALTKHPGHDPQNEHVLRWRDLHAPPTPEHFRQALHEHATGEKLPESGPEGTQLRLRKSA